MGQFEKKAEEAANKINQKYAKEIGAIQKPSDELLIKLFPTETEQKQLSELIQITQQATNDIEILNKIRDISSHFGNTAVKLIKAFVLKA